ncbi:MAG: transglutaminase domain-containing protein [Eubacterium sp.]
MKNELKKIFIAAMFILSATLCLQVQAQAKSKCKIDKVYEGYYISGKSSTSNFRVIVDGKDGMKVFSKQINNKKSFKISLKDERIKKNDKITITIRSLPDYEDLYVKKVKVKAAKWWMKGKNKKKKVAVTGYKKSNGKNKYSSLKRGTKYIQVHCLKGYSTKIKVNYGKNESKMLTKGKAKKTKNFNLSNYGISNLKSVELQIYKGKKCISTKKYKAKQPTIKNDSKDDDTPVYTGEVNWGENNIDKLLAQVEKSPTYKGTLYKINEYTIFNQGSNKEYGIIINPYYSEVQWYTKSDYNKIINEIKKYVSESHITNEMSDQEKSYRLARYIVNHIDYDLKVYGQTIEQALFEHKTVCAGFSRTYALICRYVGIDCDYVYNPNHAWNYIKIGNYYYVTDLTGAYFSRNKNTGVDDMLQSNEYVSKEHRETMEEIFRSSDYKKSHNVDSMNYLERCEKEGIAHLTRYELCHLPD